jgi:hypothetical protein
MAINPKRAFQLMERFPITTALRLIVLESVHRMLGWESEISYSQEGEDLIIESFLDLHTPGFYVDIGCHQPFKVSNTLRLYSRGWSGLVVDGNRHLIERFMRIRPKDRALTAVVEG